MTGSPRPAHVPPVALVDVARVAGGSAPASQVAVTGVSLSSHGVRPGDLYAALPGATTHGARFAAAARDAGALAVLTDPAGAALAADVGLPVVVVPEPRRRLGEVAATVYGSPAESLTLVGVTGTQGKTTTTHLAMAGFVAAGHRAALVGSTGTVIDGVPVASVLTTPEAPELHALFAVMCERGVDVCVMEVSSHSLVMGRVDGIVFDVAVFTNFGRDHLDFHGDVDSYFAAKASLFTSSRARRALLNADDEAVARLASEPEVPTHTFSATGSSADWRAGDVRSDRSGSAFRLTGPGGVDVAAEVRLPGAFNVANAVTALAALGESGASVQAGVSGVAAVEAVPGRMETLDRGQSFSVVVDYAHKPDAVAAALGALRPLTTGRLIVVLGAGGDRDTGKRPLMGEIAGRLADLVVVTDDNPRSEEPGAIRTEVIAGARRTTADVEEIADRREAIAWALSTASAGDTVVVAGKGHETGQERAGIVTPFDDRAVVGELLDELVGAAGTGGRR